MATNHNKHFREGSATVVVIVVLLVAAVAAGLFVAWGWNSSTVTTDAAASVNTVSDGGESAVDSASGDASQNASSETVQAASSSDESTASAEHESYLADGETAADTTNEDTGLTTEEEYAWELQHEDLFTDGKVEFSQGNEDLIHFLYCYANDITPEVDDRSLTDEELQGGIPYLYQWDDRWGYLTYGTSNIGLAGCGPTSLSMVIVGLTGNENATPQNVALYAEENGYYVGDEGTSWALFTTGCSEWGLTEYDVSLDEASIDAALEKGDPIICSQGPGYFTNFGHIMVLTGVDENGNIEVHDPNNRANSSRTFTYDEIAASMRAAWAYTVS
jgi:hypothetical protein